MGFVERNYPIYYLVTVGNESIKWQKILVEIKSFKGQSKTYEFHQALGQFNNYSLVLEDQEPDRDLYLAVPDFIFENFFQRALVQKAVKRFQIKILVFDPLEKTILKWVK